jgi:hypothetical protein
MVEKKNLVECYDRLLNDFYKQYAAFLESSFSNGLWKGGEYNNQRIKLFTLEKNIFNNIGGVDKRGVYIFGHEKIPLYIGKTVKQTLFKRLNGRYLFGKNSQYELAKKHKTDILNWSEEKTIRELKRMYKTSRVRSIGVKAFVDYGIENIWFILIPIEDKKIISGLEATLIATVIKCDGGKMAQALLNIDT